MAEYYDNDTFEPSSVQTAIALASEIGEDCRTMVGKNTRQKAVETTAAMAADALVKAGGTIHWVGKDGCPMGFESIWQYIAGTYHPDALGAKPKQIAECADEHAASYKHGITSLAAKMLDKGYVLFRTPTLSGNKVVQTITLDPDYVPNGSAKSVGEVFSEREKGRAEGQVKHVVERLAIVEGAQATNVWLAQAASSIGHKINRIATQRNLVE